MLGNVLSHVGDFVQDIAQSWLVWHMTRSPFLLGLVSFFDTVPRLFFGIIGGALADRIDRRRLMMWTQTMAMTQAFVYWIAVYYDFIRFWHVLLLCLFLGAVNSVNQIARQSLINTMVPKEDLLNAIALQSSAMNGAKIIGPSLGGIFIALVGIAGCFFINAVSFLAIIASLLLMNFAPGEKKVEKAGMWTEIQEGFRYVKTSHGMLAIFFLSYVVALMGAPYARFLPAVATNILHVGPAGYGFLMGAPGVGAASAALFLAYLDITPTILLIASCALGFSFSIAFFAFSQSFFLSLGLLTLIGFFFMGFRALANTAIMTEAPPDLLGRVLSLFFLDRGLLSLGALFIGGTASFVGVPWAFVTAASLCVLTAAPIAFAAWKKQAHAVALSTPE